MKHVGQIWGHFSIKVTYLVEICSFLILFEASMSDLWSLFNKNNIHVKDTISEDEFVNIRESRDKTLGMPNLIIPSIQVNMRAGNLPPSEENGNVYLKIPINGMKNLI